MFFHRINQFLSFWANTAKLDRICIIMLADRRLELPIYLFWSSSYFHWDSELFSVDCTVGNIFFWRVNSKTPFPNLITFAEILFYISYNFIVYYFIMIYRLVKKGALLRYIPRVIGDNQVDLPKYVTSIVSEFIIKCYEAVLQKWINCGRK